MTTRWWRWWWLLLLFPLELCVAIQEGQMQRNGQSAWLFFWILYLWFNHSISSPDGLGFIDQPHLHTPNASILWQPLIVIILDNGTAFKWNQIHEDHMPSTTEMENTQMFVDPSLNLQGLSILSNSMGLLKITGFPLKSGLYPQTVTNKKICYCFCMDFNKFNTVGDINLLPCPRFFTRQAYALEQNLVLWELIQILIQFPCCSVQVPGAPGALAWCQVNRVTHALSHPGRLLTGKLLSSAGVLRCSSAKGSHLRNGWLLLVRTTWASGLAWQGDLWKGEGEFKLL